MNYGCMINIYWFVMKLYIFINHKLNLSYNFYKELFHSISKCKSKNLTLIKNSKIVNHYNYNDILLSDINHLEYEYLIYKYINSSESKNYIKLFNNLLDIKDIKETNISDIKSNISFIVVNLQILDDDSNIINTYDINKYLKNDNECYYTNDSELFTKDFMNWIFIKYLKIIPSKYIINIMDNNIANIQITEKTYIKLYKNSYEIIEINK